MWRKFYELHTDASSPFASRTVETMGSLWVIEETVRGQYPAERKLARQDQSAPIAALLFALWENELPRLSGKSRVVEAIRYATSRRVALERFVADDHH